MCSDHIYGIIPILLKANMECIFFAALLEWSTELGRAESMNLSFRFLTNYLCISLEHFARIPASWSHSGQTQNVYTLPRASSICKM